jgi:hypothetical protein
MTQMNRFLSGVHLTHGGLFTCTPSGRHAVHGGHRAGAAAVRQGAGECNHPKGLGRSLVKALMGASDFSLVSSL